MMERIRHFHRWIAFALCCFLLLHLGTHLAAIWGPQAHGEMLLAVRPLYRAAWLEPLLLLAFIVQIGLGARLLVHRWPDRRSSVWSWLQIGSGVIIAIFVLMHAGAALAARHLAGLDTNFYWPAGTLAIAPLKYGFAPYYALGVSAVFVHLAAALHFNGRAAAAPFVATAGVLLALLLVLIFSGAFYTIELPDTYRDYFGAYPGVSAAATLAPGG